MTSSADTGESEKDLLAVLVAAQVISEAQAELARFDSNERGMTLEEVLLARRGSQKIPSKTMRHGFTTNQAPNSMKE